MMIPPDLVSRQQISSEQALRPVAPVQEITDKLSDFTVGQRLMAEVQAMLPNGTYRALVNQRNITLALPFSAKAGDSLELEVTESEGRLALAVLSQRKGGAEGKESVMSTLSRTGQLISQLFSGAGKDGKALALNGNRPLAGTPPGNAQDILPALKEAITRSGMFYESHQAEWIEGRLAKMELMREPQGKLSTAAPPDAEAQAKAGQAAAQPETAQKAAASVNPQQIQTAGKEATEAGAAAQKAAAGASQQAAGQIVAPQVQGIVHHQLEALANQTFVWQGQIWPGQDMRWEIEEDGHNQQDEEGEEIPGWRTRLDLSFPGLGGISARLQLLGNQVSLSLEVNKEASLGVMRSDAETLRQRLDDAGLSLASLGIALSAESG
ncbi:hypothetical protein FACS1894158_15120 [Betaproteobacteria bacterium]|nr:hypothetical protein FACS1894158_15120 [Betaproteobacteria bacterium]